MPDATPTSIAPPSPVPRHKRPALWRVAQYAVAILVLVFVARAIIGDWNEWRNAPLHANPSWGYVLASGAVVIATYALLIEVWRRILRAWGTRIRLRDAVRIWCVSNLGKYVPGKVWQILAMTELSRRANVSPIPAAGAAVLNTVVNIGIGFAVGIIAGFRALNAMSGGHATVGIAITVVIFLGVLLLPMLLPQLARIAERVSGRTMDLGTLPASAVYIALVGNVIAWLLYGWSFQLLVHGVLGRASGRPSDYVAAYALSYVIGYLVFFVPGGIGVRESVQTTALSVLNLASPKEAFLVSIASRLWLTILEVVPGLFYLARGSTRLMPKPDDSRPTR